MPFSTVRSTGDVDAFRAAIRPANPEYLITGRGAFSATVTKIDLHRLQMQRLSESLARARRVCSTRADVYFPATPGTPMTSHGVEFGATDVGVRAPFSAEWNHVSGQSQTAVMSLAADDLARLGRALVGHDVAVSPGSVLVSVSPPTQARLRRLHGAAVHLAHTAPEVITNPDAARGLEAALAEAFVDCLATGRPRAEGAATRRHGAIIRRFRDLVEERPGEPLYLAEVCEAVGVSRRALHLCCHEHLGVGPKRYLTLRRLHLAREALRLGSPDKASVTDVATQFGFWELGRFAVAYRSVFGETPSATLRSVPR